jgi:UDP-N-acetylglucosamine/UDP-N-acetylgalactosamine diphosphorylase
MADTDFEKTKQLLAAHGQEHLLAFWGRLEAGARRNLLAQLTSLDFNEIDDWVARHVKGGDTAHVPEDIQPPSYYPAAPEGAENEENYAKTAELGKKLISAGKVAAFVVAGGQGTRLGFDGPKGDFPISPVKNKTLFRLFTEQIAAVSRKYGVKCPWYVMASPLNYADTVSIFKSSGYYGLNPDDVFIFQQGTLPNFSFDGKVLLADESTIACSPDGHGGSLKALDASGAIDDMKSRGIEYISYWQVDNPLINIFDPLFIGLHAMENAQMSSKALKKAEPLEKVGNFCLVDGRVTVIEYSDLPDEEAYRRNPDGSLVFELGSIAIHIIDRTFVEKLNSKGFSLPLHKAVKKIPCIDPAGDSAKVAERDGVKLETFVFDALPLASRSIILETIRSQEFAPVKNAEGVDSIQTSKQMQIARAAAWLQSAGISIPQKEDGAPDCVLEIAPSFALCKSDVPAKADGVPRIKPGDKVYLE